MQNYIIIYCVGSIIIFIGLIIFNDVNDDKGLANNNVPISVALIWPFWFFYMALMAFGYIIKNFTFKLAKFQKELDDIMKDK